MPFDNFLQIEEISEDTENTGDDKTVEDDSTMVKEENSEDHSVVLKPPEEIRKEETEAAENHPPDYHDISSLLSKFKKRDSPAESKEEKNKNHVDFIERI